MESFALRLIGTTDLHARVHPFDYFRDVEDPRVGLAKAATLIRRLRDEAPGALVLDNGDLIQGSPLADWAAVEIAAGRLQGHPMIAAMNALDYDAATVGNHEFNYGLEVLDAALAGARFPVVCCNVLRADGSLYFRPWTMVERRFGARVVKVGVVGFVTPQIVRWDRDRLAGRVTARGIVEAAHENVAACRAAGADVIVALCHAGVARPGADAEENAGLALAQSGGIDAIFVGHQHLLLPGPDFVDVAGVDAARGALAGTPATMAGCFGGYVGVIDLTLTVEGETWRVSGGQARLAAVESATPADPPTLAAAQDAHRATLAYVRQPVGELDEPLVSHFAMIGDDPSVRIVHDSQLWFARRLAEGAPALRAAPLLSAAAPFRCGGRNGPNFYTDVPAGPLLLRSVAALYAYPNAFRIVRASGAEVREWLERAASVFERLDPARADPQPLLSLSFAPYDFDSLAGVTYRLDPTQPARYDEAGRLVAPQARRVADLRFEDRPLDDGASFHIVTNSYRANGGGHFPACDGRAPVYDGAETNFEVLLAYVKAQPRLRPSPGGFWRFAPWPESVTATLLAPPAAARTPAPPGVTAAPFGAGPDGFATYRIIPVSP